MRQHHAVASGAAATAAACDVFCPFKPLQIGKKNPIEKKRRRKKKAVQIQK
jgi:hypothetical protein